MARILVFIWFGSLLMSCTFHPENSSQPPAESTVTWEDCVPPSLPVTYDFESWSRVPAHNCQLIEAKQLLTFLAVDENTSFRSEILSFFVDIYYRTGLQTKALDLMLIDFPIETDADVVLPEGLEFADAKEFILSQARNSHLVILNEAHPVSGHRFFARELLEELEALGFSYLALEAFNPRRGPFFGSIKNGIPSLETFGYPTDSANTLLVYEALRLGFKLIPYEALEEIHGPVPHQDALSAHSWRESTQARNIYDQTFASDPNAKVFALVGYSHLIEEPIDSVQLPGRKAAWMAARLKELSGHDPLTIDQTSYWPTGSQKFSSREYRKLGILAPKDRPSAIILNGEPAPLGNYSDNVDVVVYHPDTPNVRDRSAWYDSAADLTAVGIDVQIPHGHNIGLVNLMPRNANEMSLPFDELLVTENGVITLYTPKNAEFEIIGYSANFELPNTN